MPFRATMKKAFGGGKKSEEDFHGDLGSRKSTRFEQCKPGEVPASKYSGKWDQEHQAKLMAFSFTNAFGRKGSTPSAYSPAGTKAQSRRSSWVSRRKNSEKDIRSIRLEDKVLLQVTEVEDTGADTTHGKAAETVIRETAH